MYPLPVVCRVPGVTQSGFYAWRATAPSPRDHERDRLRTDLCKVFDIHSGRYGAPRLYRVLREQHGCFGSLNRIKTLMRAMELRARAGWKLKVTTDSAQSLPMAPNLPRQDFSSDATAQSTAHAKAPDQVWLSAITYLWTREGWVYVCAVLDLFSRRIGGWAMADHMRHAAIDERHRQLFRQGADGEFLAFNERRREAWSGLWHSR